MQHKHFTCTITFKRLKEDFQKKNCGWHSKLTKNNLFIQFNPLQHLNKVKKLNIEVEILTMIYYLKIEHIIFLIPSIKCTMICYSTPWESLISLYFVLLELFSIRSGLQRSWCRYTHERRVELFLWSCWTWLPGIDFVCQLLVNSVNTFTMLSMAIEKLWTWVIQWFIANRKRQVLVHHRKPKASLTYTVTVG